MILCSLDQFCFTLCPSLSKVSGFDSSCPSEMRHTLPSCPFVLRLSSSTGFRLFRLAQSISAFLSLHSGYLYPLVPLIAGYLCSLWTQAILHPLIPLEPSCLSGFRLSSLTRHRLSLPSCVYGHWLSLPSCLSGLKLSLPSCLSGPAWDKLSRCQALCGVQMMA